MIVIAPLGAVCGAEGGDHLRSLARPGQSRLGTILALTRGAARPHGGGPRPQMGSAMAFPAVGERRSGDASREASLAR